MSDSGNTLEYKSDDDEKNDLLFSFYYSIKPEEGKCCSYQTYTGERDWHESVVMIDGSTDNTALVAEEAGPFFVRYEQVCIRTYPEELKGFTG